MIRINTVKDVQEYFKLLLEVEAYEVDKTGCKIIELRSASFLADKPAIFGRPNEDYIKREIEWYNSMSRNVYDIPGGPPEIWKQVASSDGSINSNYGWCIFSGKNGNQFDRVRVELTNNPESRRAVMIYTRPEMWSDYNIDGMSDFMCTNTVQYMIRDNKVEAHVQMRSNDVVFGYKNDYAWQKYVLNQLVWELNGARNALEHYLPGNIYWNVGSLHVYERHFNLVK